MVWRNSPTRGLAVQEFIGNWRALLHFIDQEGLGDQTWNPVISKMVALMSAEPIPGTDRVQCKCGWQGTTEDLRDKTCPICGEAFESWPITFREMTRAEFDAKYVDKDSA